jgi:2-haloacid dehalogenase
VPERPIIIFDVNQTLLNLDAIRPPFDRIFNDPPPCAGGSPT